MIKIISDGASDLTQEEQLEYKVDLVPFAISDEDGNDIQDPEVLFRTQIENPKARFFSACPSVDQYYELFKKYASEGHDIFCVTISAAISGSFNSATVAATQVLEEYPNVRIRIVDSMKNTAIQGLLVMNIAKLANRGETFEYIEEYIDKDPDEGTVFFTVENLNYLIAGGRMGKITGMVANKLNIKPIITMRGGILHSCGFGIGIKSTFQKMFDQAKAFFEKTKQDVKDFSFLVGYTFNKQLGIELLEACKQKLGITDDQVKLMRIGSTSAVHTGPNTYGFAYIRSV